MLVSLPRSISDVLTPGVDPFENAEELPKADEEAEEDVGMTPKADEGLKEELPVGCDCCEPVGCKANPGLRVEANPVPSGTRRLPILPNVS